MNLCKTRAQTTRRCTRHRRASPYRSSFRLPAAGTRPLSSLWTFRRNSFPRSPPRDSPFALERDGERAQNCLPPPPCRGTTFALPPSPSALSPPRSDCHRRTTRRQASAGISLLLASSWARARARGNYSLTFGANRSSMRFEAGRGRVREGWGNAARAAASRCITGRT